VEINWAPVCSPDDRHILYTLFNGGRNELWIADFPAFQSRKMISRWGTVSSPRWHPNGREIFFLQVESGGKSLMSVKAQLEEWEFAEPRKLFDLPEEIPLLTSFDGGFGFEVASDGERFLMMRKAERPDGRQGRVKAWVVQNWFEEFP
jgi:hypothetical protein